ncbi:MAG: hypothetical protein ABR608_06550, partial [Pseudonocardiaceae bacterium]
PMSTDLDASPSFQAALDLVFSGRREPNGYTERALTVWRQRAKAGGDEPQAREAVLSDQPPSPSLANTLTEHQIQQSHCPGG